MFSIHHENTSQFGWGKASVVMEQNRIEPHFRAFRIAFDVHVRWLSTITREEEAAIGADAQNGGHGTNVGERNRLSITLLLPHNALVLLRRMQLRASEASLQ